MNFKEFFESLNDAQKEYFVKEFIYDNRFLTQEEIDYGKEIAKRIARKNLTLIKK